MFRPLFTPPSPRGAFQPDARFGARLVSAPPVRIDDPISDAWDEGFRTATAQVRDDMARVAAANAQIEQAYTRLTETESEALAERLRETVIALCGAVLEGAATDPELLLRRVGTALALLRRSSDDKVLRINPDDLALVGHRLPPGLEAIADRALERGALRIETPVGGVEDGPAQWREAISEAVRAC